MPNFNIINARDAVYAINAYQAINGLQRFNYRYTAREQDVDEIGNPLRVDTSFEPETTGSFEITDTATLAPLFARMRYDYSTQAYLAGNAANLTTNVGVTITEDDVQYFVFDLVEQKKPGGTFSEAKLIPNVYLTRFNIRVNADGIGSASFDWQGNLLIPVYKPYHKVQSYPVTRTTASTATVNAGWSVTSGTHGILGAMVNNIQLSPTDLTWTSTNVVTIQAAGLTKIGSLTTEDRIMVWLYSRAPGTDTVPIDYVNSIKWVRADRINIWLVPSGTTTNDANRMLRVQSVDVSGDVSRDELKEILRNESRTSTFMWALRYPLNFTGTVNILETTLHKWAELQGKTLNESATEASVDVNNVLDVASWIDAKLVIEWYKYGSLSPLQRLTFAKMKVVGYEGTMAVNGRKEAVYSLKSDGDFSLEGLAD
jgi:hypothetical protein